jgi:hypothetical protein
VNSSIEDNASFKLGGVNRRKLYLHLGHVYLFLAFVGEKFVQLFKLGTYLKIFGDV